MPPIQRRHFLQATGATLASLGLSQFNWLHHANQYGRVLAQGTPGRKLALLVGINQYPDEIGSLRGCLTDVDLQRELLIHRYGFNPNDIFVVHDGAPFKPTRQTILQAFEHHLIRQAKPNDVVVFHYSGHGSLVHDPNALPALLKNDNGKIVQVPNDDRVNGTLVPYDRVSSHPGQVHDIMGRSLFLLMHALKTDQVTVVLDSCHSGAASRGNLIFRSVPSRSDGAEFANPSPVEIEFQQRWMRDLNLSEAEFQTLRQKGIAKGVAIGSANYDQPAADVPFDNDSFRAGAFTYVLTRYLWQQSLNESIGTVFVNLGRSTRDIANRSGAPQQDPIFAANPDHDREKPVYFLQPTVPYAEAVVRSIKAGVIEYWLGGVSSRSLETNQKGTLFSVLDTTGREVAQIEQQDRQKLVGFGTLHRGSLSAIQPGMLLRERIRGLPTRFTLKIGLDPSLGQDHDAAKTALQANDRVEIATQQTATYRLGRMTTAYQTQLQSLGPLPATGSTGLFTADLRPLGATFGEPGEAIAAAMTRLTPRFQSLLAAEVLRTIGGVDVVSGRHSPSLRVNVLPTSGSGGQRSATQFKQGTDIQIHVKNTSDRDLFVGVVSIGSAGSLRVLFPYFDAADDRARVAPQQVLMLPEPGVVFPLQTPGSIEIIAFASTDPIREALNALQVIASRGGVSSSREISRSALRGEDALEMMNALLGNVDRNARSSSRETGIDSSADVRAVDTNQFSLISLLIEVVNA